ncbi:DUF4959 domain-containing protein [Tamlana agarivorans]|uniref:DUF4959 domain-containing protein n=1 Tax=Pseudotamlana agarivorans TaxID=481183 RepID=A0ACC5U9E0_9FLAO|nr:DUF5000 domain-containing lipoprotein [Tamlana agarivorans]MBU2950921.1 DUF4959 domain-containing protein [Tamlana agarivorans]
MNNKLSILLLCVATFFSCEEDTIRPLVIDDGVSPSSIQNIIVDNFAGGAKLTYSLPQEEDLLYVEAEFIRQDNAEISRVRASLFNNTLEVHGFGEEKDYEINLYAVDQSENKSAPVTTIIRPLRAPIQFVGESLEVFPDFGGMYVSWENPYETNVSLEISVLDEFGQPNVVDIVYSEALEGGVAIRGFDPVEKTFTIVVKDRYGNIYPTQRFVVTPLFEEAADKTYYRTLAALGLTIPHETPAFNARWGLENIYNGDTRPNVRQAFLSAASSWIDPDGELPGYEGLNAQYFTLDIGTEIKLSRILMHTAAFDKDTPKVFDIWGANQLNADGSLDGWVKIADKRETIKPSGTPYGVDPTQEDIEAAERGFDVLIDANAPPVRYIRFVNRQSWDGNTLIKIAEMEFFGEIIN